MPRPAAPQKARHIGLKAKRLNCASAVNSTMMSYKIAKKLKDAGFPQSELARAQQEAGYEYVSMPTLSVLIEVCGDDFRALSREGDSWLACGYIEYGEWKNVHTGDTPEEAVARLWLSVHTTTLTDDDA
jgi:hypothetical protein